MTRPLPYAGLSCPRCRYDLTGLSEPRGPECGEFFDPTALRRLNAWWRLRPSWYATIGFVALALYVPCSWVFWIDHSWNGYRWFWVKLSPILPAGMPMFVIHHWVPFDEPLGIALLTIITAALGVTSVYLAHRSRMALIVVCVALLVYGIYNAIGCYAIFHT